MIKSSKNEESEMNGELALIFKLLKILNKMHGQSLLDYWNTIDMITKEAVFKVKLIVFPVTCNNYANL